MPAKEMYNQSVPVAVSNLRKIWDAKKVEMKFTQVEAANKLGWTQGAISHYLNNITSLNPQATIKFANFLGVDPMEIDPSIKEHLPNTRTRNIRYDSSDITKKLDQKYYDKIPESAFWVTTYPSDYTYLKFKRDGKPNETQWLTCVCPVKDFPNATVFMVQEKGKKNVLLYRKEKMPADSKIQKKWAVLETQISLAVI